MQPAPKLLTEKESASIAGVTEETLKKYISYGLLDFITDDNGQKLLSREELSDIFQIENEQHTEQVVEEPANLQTDQCSSHKIIEENIILMGTNLGQGQVSKPRKAAKPDTGSKQAAGPIPISPGNQDPSLELIEINAHLRERVKSLRAERDWLRERVEKLETQLEREQTLLMSESENLRRLITLHSESKRTGITAKVKSLLGWNQ